MTYGRSHTSDLDKAWSGLEEAEHYFELHLNEELLRQQRLEQLADRFKRKATMREKWLQDSQRLVACDRFGSNLSSVEAAFKKQEAIQTDIGSFDERLNNVMMLVQELEIEKYHDCAIIVARKKKIVFLWHYLLELVCARRRRLQTSYASQKILAEIDFLLCWIDEIIATVDKDDVNANLIQIGDMVQCHDLLKNDIAVIGDRIQQVCQQAQPFIDENRWKEEAKALQSVTTLPSTGEASLITSKHESVNSSNADMDSKPTMTSDLDFTSGGQGLAIGVCSIGDHDEEEQTTRYMGERVELLKLRYQCLVEASLLRDECLEAGSVAHHLLEDTRNEHEWIRLKTKELRSILDDDQVTCALATQSMRNRYEAIRSEITAREHKIMEVANRCQAMKNSKAYVQCIEPEFSAMTKAWRDLLDSADTRDKALRRAEALQDFQASVDETNTWLLEMLRICSCEDVGKDEHSALSMLAKHSEVRDTLIAYTVQINKLQEEAYDIIQRHEVGEENSVIKNAMDNINRRHQELMGLCDLHQRKLEDAVALFRLIRNVDNVEAWIEEKDRFLRSLDPSQASDIEALEVMKHRFDGFDREMLASASKVAIVNQLGRQLVADDHPGGKEILERLSGLNEKWSDLRKLVELRRDELHSTFGVQTFHIECDETISWIEDKVKIVQSTENMDRDLSGVMAMQRRLSGLERDLNVIQAKLDQLDMEAERLEQTHPLEADAVHKKISHINAVWYELKDTLRRREESMGEAAVLQRFLRDLDHFSQWLTRTQTEVASEDTPDSLQSAEYILNRHQCVKEEIDRYAPDYAQMREYGQRVIRDADSSDPQYVFLRERLNALDDGWNELDQMWHQKQNMLSEAMHLQMYDRDAAQSELLLNKQEYYLNNVDEPRNLDEAELLMKKHDDFTTSLQASEEKIQQLWQFAQRLVHESHYASDRIMDKARSTVERFSLNRNNAMNIGDRLRENIKYYQFTQDCDELKEWLDAKTTQARDDSYRDTRNIHSKYLRHQAFSAEIMANRERLQNLKQAAFELGEEQPGSVGLIEARVVDLDRMWGMLEDVTKAKGEQLFDANRDTLYQQCISDVNRFVNDLEQHLTTEDDSFSVCAVSEQDADDILHAIKEVGADIGGDLTRTNLALTKQAVLEREFDLKQQQVQELKEQAERLKEAEPERSEIIDSQRLMVEERFNAIRQPLEEQKLKLARQKRVHQLLRDIEDECMWAEDQRFANLQPEVDSLLAARRAINRNEATKAEVDGRIKTSRALRDEAEELSTEVSSTRSEEFKIKLANLDACFASLQNDIDNRSAYLYHAMSLQKFLADVEEAECWLSEHELVAMIDDTGRDETATRSLVRKHKQVEATVFQFIQQLNQMKVRVQENGDLYGEDKAQQAYTRLYSYYETLTDTCGRRSQLLNDALNLHLIRREIDDLRQWIAEHEAICNSSELGIDFEHVTLLQQRFQTFSKDTKTRGAERVSHINQLCDELRAHPQLYLITQWRDRVAVECWSDLLEMLQTRKEALHISYQLQKYFYECREAMSLIAERQNSLSDQLGRDAKGVFALQRKHAIFEQDLVSVRALVSSISQQCAHLSDLYAGERAAEVSQCQEAVRTAWGNLQLMLTKRNTELANCADMHRFFNLARDLTIWMEGILRQMRNTSTAGARDVSGVDLLINNHHGLKAEIAARDENLTMCVNMGKDLLAKKHVRSVDIKDRCVQLCLLRDRTVYEWEDRWEHLKLELEVYQFARDASVAEAWLVSQESYLQVSDLGRSLDEVENLIKKHEAFEKSIIAQEDRFNALKQLTSLEKRGQHPTKPRVRENRQTEYEYEFRTWDEKEMDTAAGTFKRQLKDVDRLDAGDSGTENCEPGETSLTGKLVFAGVSTDVPGIMLSKTPNDVSRNLREGYLVRKHIWENYQQKASNRSWEKYFFILSCCPKDGCALEMYKDHKHSTRRKVEDLWTLDAACQVEPATDYHKRSNVFRLTLSNGTCYMFMARDFDDMHDWIETIRNNCTGGVSCGDGRASRSEAIPGDDEGGDTQVDETDESRRKSSNSRSRSLPLGAARSMSAASRKQKRSNAYTLVADPVKEGEENKHRGRSRNPSSSSRKERGRTGGFFSIRRKKADHEDS